MRKTEGLNPNIQGEKKPQTFKKVLEEKVYPGSVEKGTKNTSDLKFRSKTQLEKEVRYHLKGFSFFLINKYFPFG